MSVLFNRVPTNSLNPAEALTDRSRRPVRYAKQPPEPIERMIVRLKKDEAKRPGEGQTRDEDA